MAWFTPFHLALGGASSLLATPGPCDVDSHFRLGAVDRVVAVLAPATVGRPFHHRLDSTEVRVRLRFVVGCGGRAEPASFALVEADDTAYVLSAVALVQASEFAPATVEGRPVRQLVERTVVWRRAPAERVVEFVCPPSPPAVARRALHSGAAATEAPSHPRPPERRITIS